MTDEVVVLGPGIFASADRKVICWRGVNYERQEDLQKMTAERDQLIEVKEAAKAVLAELDANPIGEYGDSVCEAMDKLERKLAALTPREGT